MNSKRLITATVTGAVLGVICILGVSRRLPANPLPNETIFLLGAWYNRVIMGVLIGLAGKWLLFRNLSERWNSLGRGALIGAMVSASFAFMGQEISVPYFFAGIFFGVANDFFTTWLTGRLNKPIT